MERPWKAEVPIPRETAAELLRGAFPELATATLEPLGDGWDNAAFLVHADGVSWVFRFPRRAVAAPLLATELAVLPRLGPQLPIPIPIPERVGRPTSIYPWSFSGYRHLPGTTACRCGLDDEARSRLAPVLGRFLRALHAVPAAPLRLLGLPPDTLARFDLATRLPQLEERLHTAERLGLVADGTAILRKAAATPTDRPPRTDVVVHGDLYARHLLVDAEGELSGVIDWGDVHSGDPAQDLGLVLGFLPRSARPAFLEAYGAVDDRTWAWARFRALFLAVAILVYGADVGDAALVREGREGLRFALS